MNETVKQSEEPNNIDTPAPNQSHKNKKVNFLYRTLITIVAIISIFAISFAKILSTDIGTQWTIKLVQKFVDDLEVEEVEGNLQSRLTLKNVNFQSQGIDSQFNQVDLQLDLTCLVKAEICVDQLYLKKAAINIQTSLLAVENADEKPKSPMQKVNLPISISAPNIKIEQVDLNVDHNQIQLGKLETGVQLDNQQGLELAPTEIDDLSYTINSSSKQLAKTEEKSEPINWQELKQKLAKPILQDINDIVLPFDINIHQLQAKNWQFHYLVDSKLVQQIEMAQFQLQAKATDSEIKLTQLELLSSIADVQAQGNIELTQDFPINLNLYSKLHPFKQGNSQILPASTLDLLVSGNLKKSTALSIKTQGDIEANLTTEAKLNTPQTPFDLKLDISKLSYPFDKKEKLFKIENFVLIADGDLLNPKLSLQSKIMDMYNNPIQINLQSQSDLSKLDIQQFHLSQNNNHISAKGYLSEQQNDLNLEVNAPNLSGLIPNLSVSLIGNANLKGSFTQPILDIDLTSHKIQWQDFKIAKLIFKGNVRNEGQLQSDLNLELSGVNQGDIKLNQAKLQLVGNEKSHQLKLTSNGEPIAANFDIKGNFDRENQIWSGQLSKANLSTILGDIKPNQNIEIRFDNKQSMAQISHHCWNHIDIELCFPQQLKIGKVGEIPFELKRFNLAMLNKIIEQKNLLQGQLYSKGKLNWAENISPKLDMELEGKQINLAYKIDYRTFKLSIPKLKINTLLENNDLQVKSDINLQNNGNIGTDLKINDIVNKRKLSGNLAIQGINLSLANQLLSHNEKVTGALSAKLNFAGDLKAPLLDGAIKVRDLQAKMKSSPVEIDNGDIDLNFYGDHSSLQADIQTTGGMLNIDGEADWKNTQRWQAHINAKAEQFLVNIPSIAKLKLSPDVTMTVTPNLLDLSGEINIPWARIAIEELPDSAIKVSDDEVILDAKSAVKNQKLFSSKQMAATTKSGMAITSDLKINIGDDVKIKAYGLNSELNGLLSVRQEKGELGLFGQINLKNGRYASFGQDLLIRKGQISFSGMPSQPLLNIEAIRNPEAMENQKVTAGVKVTGIAEAPNVEVFSEPSMSQDQALSYILTGRSLENSGDAGSSGSVGAALLGMGLAKSGKLVGSIGETFGIQDLNLGTSGVGASSKVVVSGNITPRLKIKYGVGLFDGLAEVTLRYRLFPQLFLQSVSGVNQSFDLLYEFEF